jgi:hypothetical protein
MDDFDRALMEALNECVPPAALSAGFADRLVARRRRDKVFWRLIFSLIGVSALCAAAFTVSFFLPSKEESGVENNGDDSGIENALTNVSQTNSQFSILNSQFSNGRAASPLAAAESPPSSTTSQGENQMNMNKVKKALLGAAAISAAQLGAGSGEYQFIISGYPAADNCHSDVSSGTSLEFGVLSGISASDALDARSRTDDLSNHSPLRSDKFRGMNISIR